MPFNQALSKIPLGPFSFPKPNMAANLGLTLNSTPQVIGDPRNAANLAANQLPTGVLAALTAPPVAPVDPMRKYRDILNIPAMRTNLGRGSDRGNYTTSGPGGGGGFSGPNSSARGSMTRGGLY